MLERHGARRKDFLEVTLRSEGGRYLYGDEAWPRIESFAEPF